MKVLILGGGATGSVMAKTLANFDIVDQVYVGDISDKNAKKFLVSHPKIVDRSETFAIQMCVS